MLNMFQVLEKMIMSNLFKVASDLNRVYAIEHYLNLEVEIMKRLDQLSGANNV